VTAHKHHDPPRRRFGRLKLAAAGLLLAGFGAIQLLHGVQVMRSVKGDMFSWGFVAAGAICLLLAVVPMSWIIRAAGNASR
jgi:hypothetical protein